MEDIEEEQPARKKDHRLVPSTIAMAEVKASIEVAEAPAGLPVKKIGTTPSLTQTKERVGAKGKATDALAGELWEKKRERIRKTSKWSSSPDWDLRSASIHSIKSRNSDVTSLREFFCKKYVEGSPAFKLAQWNLLARSCGHNIGEYTDLQTWLVAKGDSENDTRTNSDEASIIQTGLTGDVNFFF